MNKQWYKDRIYGYQLKIVQLFSDTLHTVPKRTVLRDAKKILAQYTVLLKLDQAEVHSLWNWTVNSYNKISRKTWGDREKIPEALAGLYKSTEREKNLIADNVEFREKHSRALEYINSDNVFYRLSTHSNCAVGHVKYQGHIFINEDAANEEELKYARNNGILTIRDVMFSEPFLTTRRNCKHVFIPVPSELVLNNTLPPVHVINDTPLNSPYRAYYDRKNLLIAAGISKKNDSYKRTVSLIRKYRAL